MMHVGNPIGWNHHSRSLATLKRAISLLALSEEPPTQAEDTILHDLSRAGKRLMGFCRTNLFKRLASSGQVLLLSSERHILRNFIYLHAIENNMPIPIGTQDMGMLDTRIYDEYADDVCATGDIFDNEHEGACVIPPAQMLSSDDFKKRAADIYEEYTTKYKKRFKWLRPHLFIKTLVKDLESDTKTLLKVLKSCGQWDSQKDAKLSSLTKLLSQGHAKVKVLIFTQFADTVRYLERELKGRGINALSGVTGDTSDPSAVEWRFSPVSNNRRATVKPEHELRVLIATDVLSEGQNLQDCSVVVNYDLPWAIIRLIQRAGRVDHIGQLAENILCYSFLPAEGVNRIIHLHQRVRRRLQENPEVVGTDEAFFEDDRSDQPILDLYHEKAGILDGEADAEVDLASYAYQIWKNAVTKDPKLEKIIPALPQVVFSTKAIKSPLTPTLSHQGRGSQEVADPESVLVYLKTTDGNDALARIDRGGKIVTESQFEILKAAECRSDTPALPRQEKHHELVQKGVEIIIAEERSVGGQLGRPSGARFRTYDDSSDMRRRSKASSLNHPSCLRLSRISTVIRFSKRRRTRSTGSFGTASRINRWRSL